jgi:hypothetical protein
VPASLSCVPLRAKTPPASSPSSLSTPLPHSSFPRTPARILQKGFCARAGARKRGYPRENPPIPPHCPLTTVHRPLPPRAPRPLSSDPKPTNAPPQTRAAIARGAQSLSSVYSKSSGRNPVKIRRPRPISRYGERRVWQKRHRPNTSAMPQSSPKPFHDLPRRGIAFSAYGVVVFHSGVIVNECPFAINERRHAKEVP